ncbi:hypothetical protein A2U01_0024322, partial [Trifolium medium]|nr:hypothetical protein [Trifolium medium]
SGFGPPHHPWFRSATTMLVSVFSSLGSGSTTTTSFVAAFAGLGCFFNQIASSARVSVALLPFPPALCLRASFPWFARVLSLLCGESALLPFQVMRSGFALLFLSHPAGQVSHDPVDL